MKKLTYSITINKPVNFVFTKLTDKSVYPLWAKAWGEGMTCEGEWKEGQHISFFDETQGGTKALVEHVVPNETIRMKHVAMVNPQNIEVALTDEMMRKWIGSREDYYFKREGDDVTTLDVVMLADEAFEEMMNVWSQALQLFKDVCEA
ncbi:SRPBCC domain-containing protein [Sphaerothrix gracilis]|uniref:SRPBCC family protein n=1 Tax=Sphaerothrix gracilis TaxID=3151835 RepID=UPI0031FDEDE1